MCMAIIVANGPALKVWYGRISSQSFWPQALPRFKIVWISRSSKLHTGISRSRIGRRSIFGRIPRLPTVQISGFHITEMRSESETFTTTYSTECDGRLSWSEVLDKPERAYYGV
jgi:hypothetical protein